MSDNQHQEFHEYDGIIEHDNPLPTWWLWTFFLTIIFSFLYYIHYELGGGPTLTQELEVAMSNLDKARSHASSAAPMETEDMLQGKFKDANLIALGAAQYAGKCAACHGNELQGLIGPNLTDDHWLHGDGSGLALLKVIREGVPEKGMPPWNGILKKDELYGVAAFIESKHGSNPPGAKEPQGEKVK